jgi:hypothetical protein
MVYTSDQETGPYDSFARLHVSDPEFRQGNVSVDIIDILSTEDKFLGIYTHQLPKKPS